MTPEGMIKSLISSVLTKHNAWYFMPVPSGYQAKTVDFIVCHRGRFIAIEAKRPGKNATQRQAYVLKQIREAGGIALTINTPELVDELDEKLTKWEATSEVMT